MNESDALPACSEAPVDQVVPGAKWEFDDEVAGCFDNMLERSIPQYDVMRQACFDVGRRFRQPATDIVDLGCSRGGALAQFIRRFGVTNRYIGVDVSEPMLAAATERFQGYIDCKAVQIQNVDLRADYPYCKASVTLAVLCLQFTPIEYRQQIIDNIYQHTVPGGCVVLVEKVLGNGGQSDKLLVDCYYDMKREHGYTDEDIDRKRHSLEGVLVPCTAKWNEELLANAGFRGIECFWRWMNFAGWVGVKPGA